ncbi:hypothetical protein FS749_015507 [Ceratobasidium sp. UAMH 11750]|nr:hypothetical protein FS749_015507 [Ceratobasidium sp. UAMH 11750]
MAPTVLTRSPSVIQTGPRPSRTTLSLHPTSATPIKRSRNQGMRRPPCSQTQGHRHRRPQLRHRDPHAPPAPNGVALGSSARPSPHGGTPTVCASRAPIVAAASTEVNAPR